MTDFSRSAALFGTEAMARLNSSHVAVIGVGGVGSWCAEALVRSGVGALTLVDDDLVASSNVNRQCPATSATLGRPKAEVMRDRLLEIVPEAKVTAIVRRYVPDGKDIALDGFDLIVDAIDSVDCKAALILAADECGVPLVSSMGAARRLDPTKVAVKRFDKVEGDGLARALRQRFRRLQRFPRPFPCVCSTEPPRETGDVKGSVMPVTCAFGMALAAEAIRLLLGYDYDY